MGVSSSDGHQWSVKFTENNIILGRVIEAHVHHNGHVTHGTSEAPDEAVSNLRYHGPN